jgi:hypothetical protein
VRQQTTFGGTIRKEKKRKGVMIKKKEGKGKRK